jgi:hypothetical protein
LNILEFPIGGLTKPLYLLVEYKIYVVDLNQTIFVQKVQVDRFCGNVFQKAQFECLVKKIVKKFNLKFVYLFKTKHQYFRLLNNEYFYSVNKYKHDPNHFFNALNRSNFTLPKLRHNYQ